MKNLLIALFISLSFIACSDDKATQNVSTENNPTLSSGSFRSLSSADVEIYAYDESGLKTLLYVQKTSSGSALADIGSFNLHLNDLNDETYYLYTLSGGINYDVDGDGEKDSVGSENNGTVHALAKGSAFKAAGDNVHFSYISELLFESIKYQLRSETLEDDYKTAALKLFDDDTLDVDSLMQKVLSIEPQSNDIKSSVKEIRSAIVDSILEGNTKVLPFVVFNEVKVLDAMVAANTVVTLELNISSELSFSDVPVSVILESDDNSTELTSFMIANLSPLEALYEVETTLPKVVSAGAYTLKVLLGDDDLNLSAISSSVDIESQAKLFIDNILTQDGESAQSVEIDTVYTQDGMRIDSIVGVTNSQVDVNISGVKLHGYLLVGGEKIEVPFEVIVLDDNVSLDDDNITSYINDVSTTGELILPTIEADSTINITSTFVLNKVEVSSILEKMLNNGQLIEDSTIVLNLSVDSVDIDQFTYPLETILDPRVQSHLTANTLAIATGSKTVAQVVDELWLVLNSTQAAPALRGCGIPMLEYKAPHLKHSKYGKRMGAGIYGDAKAWLDVDGIHAQSDASVRVKIIRRTKFDLFDVNFEANAEPASFADTGYMLSVAILNQIVYTKSNSLADISALSAPKAQLCDVNVTNDQNQSVNSSDSDGNVTVQYSFCLDDGGKVSFVDKNQTSYISINDANNSNKVNGYGKGVTYKASQKKISGSDRTLLGYQRLYRIGRMQEYSRTFVLGMIPIVVTGGADASVGYEADIHVAGITSIVSSFTPSARIGAYLEGGVGAGLSCCGHRIEYSAGVGGSFKLISDDLKVSVDASIDMIPDEEGLYIISMNGMLKEKVKNYFYGPRGRLYAYAKWWGPGKKGDRFWDWDNHKKTKTLAKWKSYKHTTTLFDEEQTLFVIPLGSDCE